MTNSAPDATTRTLHEAARLAVTEHRYADAAKSLERAVAHDASDAWAHDLLGICFQRLGRPDEALREFHASVALSPNDPCFLYNLGAMLGALGQEDDAIEALDRCLRHDPEHKLAADVLGKLRAGNTDSHQEQPTT